MYCFYTITYHSSIQVSPKPVCVPEFRMQLKAEPGNFKLYSVNHWAEITGVFVLTQAVGNAPNEKTSFEVRDDGTKWLIHFEGGNKHSNINIASCKQ